MREIFYLSVGDGQNYLLQLQPMKTVTSQDYLSSYFWPQKRKGEVIDIGKLNSKIKSIKSALKIAEQHNEDLHAKIKNMKESHQLEIEQYQTDCRKYKQLYDMLSQNYEIRVLEVKELKKRLKKAEVEQIRYGGRQITLEDPEETTKEFRETIIKHERELGRLREENRALYQQICEGSSKIKDYEHMITKGHSSPSKGEKNKYFLLNLRSALQTKNQEFDKILYQKIQLINTKTTLERENADLHLKITKISAQLEFERKTGNDLKERLGKNQRQTVKLQQELNTLTQKYSQLLTFSYEIQKDFQKELHFMGKELIRKQPMRS